jgi:hypothetical protein
VISWTDVGKPQDGAVARQLDIKCSRIRPCFRDISATLLVGLVVDGLTGLTPRRSAGAYGVVAYENPRKFRPCFLLSLCRTGAACYPEWLDRFRHCNEASQKTSESENKKMRRGAVA